MEKKLRDFVRGEREGCWPSIGQILLLKQLGYVFSTSDYKHAIVGSASLYMCQCLTQCPVRTLKDVSSGLLMCSILGGYTYETLRIVPETLEFLRSLLCFYSPVGVQDLNKNAVGSTSSVKQKLLHPQSNFDVSSPFLISLRKASTSPNSKEITSKVSWKYFGKSKTLDSVDSQQSLSLLSCTQTLLAHFIEKHSKISAFPELFNPLLTVLRALRPQDEPKLPTDSQLTHANLLEEMTTIANRHVSTRHPLQWRKKGKVIIEGKNPRFQADYTFKKDLDPDENRAKLKQLQRQMKRETKAAMRELRRDSEFIDQIAYEEQSQKKIKLRDERVKNFAWMESEQAMINQQVRKGGELLRGGGSGRAKMNVTRKKRDKRK